MLVSKQTELNINIISLSKCFEYMEKNVKSPGHYCLLK